MRSLVALVVVPLLAIACGSEAANEGANGDATENAESNNTSLTCAPMPACNGGSAPALGAKRDFQHLGSRLIAAAETAHHRGRDAIYTAGEAQWVIGKLAYGPTDKDLKDEEVDVWLERGCGGSWEKLGTSRTTNENAHAAVEGVEDSGGRVYFQIPAGKELALGRHRVRLVVAGDHTSADLLIDVVPKNMPVVVSDVDGTLTSSEAAEYPALLEGELPEARPDAPAVLTALAKKGYRPIYVTARPEWLTERTKQFLAERGFPPGIVHTTTGATGAFNGPAAEFKSAELARAEAKGLKIQWAFGNRASDTDAYDAAHVEPKDHRVFLQVDDPHGGRRIEKYADVLPAAQASVLACQ